ncbi:hypothetical protein PPSIR1_36282 [Plesiocystis pacifica SIR-1]|uniref:Uncharacterized protein n=1 Tax=Plesiocystis pacifica SIR-1 TaxID=391625 RepID=A6G1G1_9BACT|nr:hypothetical protein [Plesiocystis pacifica]EDM80225.1 hypothetical protein PPSIR1_36282 [Plesiocystis pacifica SIR-1]
MTGQRIDVGDLLTIDVESELRKLTQAQLQGPWQLPAELVRRALRGGAQRVEVELGRSSLRVRSHGDAVPLEVLRELAALLDARRDPERRHRALSALEGWGALSLLGLAGSQPASLEIRSRAPRSGGEGAGLTWKRNAGVSLERYTPPGPSHTEVIVRGAKIDRGRAREWLRSVARHAQAEIEVDGRAVDTGFHDAMFVARTAVPMPGEIAIPREGEVARLYLLQDGLLTAHLSATEAPCFEAALETRDLPGLAPGASAAAVRDAVAPHVDAIVGAAVECMIALARGGAATTAVDRSRLTQLLLQGARRRRDSAKTIARLPLFRCLEPDGRERWADLLGLRQAVRDDHGERHLIALFPDQDPSEFATEARVYILDEAERALLGELLDLGFRQPRRRVEARRGAATWLRDGLRGRRGWLAALRPGGRPIPDAELDGRERAFLAQVRAQLERCEVHMCTGGGPVRRIGRGPAKLLLPRQSEQVQAAVSAVAQEPGWVYAALLAFLDGDAFPDRARRRWRFETWGNP